MRRVALAAALAALAPAMACGGDRSGPGPATTPVVVSRVDGGGVSVESCPATLPTARASSDDPMGFERLPITLVCVVGTKSADSRRAAERVIKTRAPGELTTTGVRADLAALLEVGTFDDAAAWAQDSGSGIVLFYAVRERPRVERVVIEGATIFGDAALAKKLPIAKDAPFDVRRARGLVDALQAEYASRGYGAATVDLDATPTNDGVIVRIKVVEGPLWRFAKPTFKGNKNVPTPELEKAVRLAEGDTFDLDLVLRGELLVTELYYDRGMIQAHVTAEPQPSGSTASRPAVFTISEGPVFTLGAIRITKLGAPVEKELLGHVIQSKPRSVFARSKLVDDVQRVKDFFAARGQRVSVTPETDVDPTKKTVDLRLVVELEP